MFRCRFQVGNLLQPAHESELGIVAEQHFDEIHLFLDPAGMVEGIEPAAEQISTNVAVDLGDLASGAIRNIPAVQWRRHAGSGTHAGGTLPGVTVVLAAGTEIVLAPTGEGGTQSDLRLRFPDATRIEVGSRARVAPGGHDLRGLAPVLLNGIPLLEVTHQQPASMRLSWGATRTAILSLLVIVSPYRRRGQDALYHLVESVGNRVVGGSSLQIRA